MYKLLNLSPIKSNRIQRQINSESLKNFPLNKLYPLSETELIQNTTIYSSKTFKHSPFKWNTDLNKLAGRF